jgi:hypothetical protein
MKEKSYVRVYLQTDLYPPLKVVAASRNVNIRDLLSQIVKNFVTSRQKILEGIEKEELIEP